jgi:glycosyltransferase involved in cell wall biosynthesis
LAAAVSEDSRLRVFNDLSPQLSLAEFYAAIDAYISPSHSEGYGLNLVEASQIGIPVITNSWGISADILAREEVVGVNYDLVPITDEQGHYRNVQHARWARPRIDEMALHLRRLYDVQEVEHRSFGVSMPHTR